MSTSTPGESVNLEGTNVMLPTSLEEQKGEPEGEVFRIVKFQMKKPDSLTLADVVLHCQLYSEKYEGFFKATFDDPAKIVCNHEVPMDVIIYNLEEILSGKAENVFIVYEKVDGKKVLVIKRKIEYQMFNTTVAFEFCYIFQSAKMSFEEQINMKLGEVHQKINELKVGDNLHDLSTPKFFIAGKHIENAKFDASRNNQNCVKENGKLLTRKTTSTAWSTTPVNTLLGVGLSYRARFRVISMSSNMMFGVVSSSFSVYTNYPQGNGSYGWVAYVPSYKLQSSYVHNGSFANSGICVLKGSIVTVEYYQKQGIIQYFVNNTPAALHYGCTFNNGNARFAVVFHNADSEVKLLSVEQIEDAF